MPTYTAPVKDMQFLLHNVLKVTASDTPGYSELDESFTAAVLEEAGKVAADVLAPLNAVGDREGCVLENGVVRTPKGFDAAFKAMKDGGWTALDCDPDYGGQGLPYLMGSAVGEIFVSANMAFNMYQGLTHGAYSAIHTHGTDAQKATYLPKLVSFQLGQLAICQTQKSLILRAGALLAVHQQPLPDFFQTEAKPPPTQDQCHPRQLARAVKPGSPFLFRREEFDIFVIAQRARSDVKPHAHVFEAEPAGVGHRGPPSVKVMRG